MKCRSRHTDFVQTCFVVKGAELPPETQFSTRFLTDLKAMCRSLAVRDKTSPATESVATTASTITGGYVKSMRARKTQQPGPKAQLFNLSAAASLPSSEPVQVDEGDLANSRAMAGVQEQKCYEKGTEEQHNDRLLVQQNSGRTKIRTAEDARGKKRQSSLVRTHAGNKRDIFSHVSTSAKARVIEEPCTNIHGSRSTAAIKQDGVAQIHNYSRPMTENHRSNRVKVITSEPPPASINYLNKVTTLATPIRLKSSRVIKSASPAKAESKRPRRQENKDCTVPERAVNRRGSYNEGNDFSTSAKRGLNELDSLQERMLEIKEHLTELKSTENELEDHFKELRREIIRGVDIEMKQRHEAEMKKLSEQHKAEASAARENFDSVKSKHNDRLRDLKEQRNEMLEQLMSIKEQMRRIREEWTPDQMRELIDGFSHERAQKRRRTFHQGDATGEN